MNIKTHLTRLLILLQFLMVGNLLNTTSFIQQAFADQCHIDKDSTLNEVLNSTKLDIFDRLQFVDILARELAQQKERPEKRRDDRALSL